MRVLSVRLANMNPLIWSKKLLLTIGHIDRNYSKRLITNWRAMAGQMTLCITLLGGTEFNSQHLSVVRRVTTTCNSISKVGPTPLTHVGTCTHTVHRCTDTHKNNILKRKNKLKPSLDNLVSTCSKINSSVGEGPCCGAWLSRPPKDHTVKEKPICPLAFSAEHGTPWYTLKTSKYNETEKKRVYLKGRKKRDLSRRGSP